MNIHKLSLRTLQILSTLFTGLNAGLFFIFSYDINIAFELLSGAEYGYIMKIINEAIRNPWFFTVFFGDSVGLSYAPRKEGLGNAKKS